MARPKPKAVRGVYEYPLGSGVWWVNYYVNGRRHREKVGRKSDAIDLYQTRKADARAGRKLPVLRNTKAVTVSDLVDLAIEFTAGHKDKRNYISRGEIVREQLGDREAAAVTPQDIDQWLSKRCKTAATANRYRAFLSLCYWLESRTGGLPVTLPAWFDRGKRTGGVSASSPERNTTGSARSFRSDSPNTLPNL